MNFDEIQRNMAAAKKRHRERMTFLLILRVFMIVFLLCIIQFRIVPVTHTWFNPVVGVLMAFVVMSLFFIRYAVKELLKP